MSNRQERKLMTRQALMNAALAWVEEGESFSSLSIREVAKRAGVVPTAFYRHFKDLDELALNLVDQLSLVLRQLMREVRQRRDTPAHIVRESVKQFFDHAEKERVMFLFMSQSLTGGSKVVREAIRSELMFFAKELVVDIQRMNLLTNLDTETMDNVADLTIKTMAYSVTPFLDALDDGTQPRDQFAEKMVQQLKLIFIGALAWRKEAATVD